MLKRALRAIMDDNVTSLLSDIAHLLLEMYQIVPQAAMLDLAKQVSIFVFKEVVLISCLLMTVITQIETVNAVIVSFIVSIE